MTNPIQVMFDEVKGTFVFVIFVAIIVFVLAAMGVAFGMPEFTNKMIESISFGMLLILAIPSIGGLVAVIIWVRKKMQNEG